MKKCICSLLVAISMVSFASCASQDKTTEKPDTKSETMEKKAEKSAESTSKDDKGNEKKNEINKKIIKFENTKSIDFSNLTYMTSESEKDIKLEDAFAKVYDLKRGEDNISYYYNKIDLNGDNVPEIFVLLMGPPVCGSGGCSAAIFKNNEKEYTLVSKFTLVKNPVIISDEKTNGWKNIIMQVSGGGETFFSELKFDGKQYPMNPSVQPKVKDGTKVKGTAIISDDPMESNGVKF